MAVVTSCGMCKATIVHVSTEGVSHSQSCQMEDSRTHCPSLDALQTSNVSDSMLILVIGTQLPLSRTLTFENLTDIAIVGDSKDKIIITCKKDGNGGIAFRFVRNITISNLAFVHCGALHGSTSTNLTTLNSTMKFRITLYLQQCTDVSITNVDVTYSNGIGVVFFDTNGTVNAQNSTFSHNYVSSFEKHIYPGGGGMYIEFTACPPGVYRYGNCNHTGGYNTDGKYVIHNCNFTSNVATSLEHQNSSYITDIKANFQRLGRGGGLHFLLQSDASNNKMTISNCKFYNNSALWGGGLLVFIEGSPLTNVVNIINSTFIQNYCDKNGGGAVDIGIWLSLNPPPTILFENCTFQENHAQFGGAVIVAVATNGNRHNTGTNFTIFQQCTWFNNSAITSAAVDITAHSPDLLLGPFLVFTDCRFISNKVQQTHSWIETDLASESNSGHGTFMVTYTKVVFINSVHFENNTGSALYIISGRAEFSARMTASFISNQGVNGGAIALTAGSSLLVQDDSTFTFTGNEASVMGGAIYSYTLGEHNLHSYILISSCFLQYSGNRSFQDDKNITFIFSENLAGKGAVNLGNSIFANSFLSCAYACIHGHIPQPLTINKAFVCIGRFEFGTDVHQPRPGGTGEVASGGKHFEVTGKLPLRVLPGVRFTVPVSVKDEFENTVNSLFQVSVQTTDHEAKPMIIIDPGTLYVSNNQIRLYGSPDSIGTLTLQRIGFHGLHITLNLMLVHCPPGYILNSVGGADPLTHAQECVCAWNVDQSYRGILKCNSSLFQALLLHGFWSGYYGSRAVPENLCTAICPLDYCKYNGSGFLPVHLLPGSADAIMLDKFMCGPTRTGILCGTCQENHSVYFHSPRLECRENQLCRYGLLFYVVSELLPVTALFVVIMLFNISFTSGAVNGFVFFAQVLDTLATDANGVAGIQFSKAFQVLTEVYQFTYRLFNLDFFGITPLSFCLWQGATTLDIVAFKYITITYALLLVLLTVLFMKCFNLYHTWQIQLRIYHKDKSSVIHGLAAFLVMCYAQCVRVSLQLLVPVRLQQQGYEYSSHQVVFYHGDIEFFSIRHLKYAVPAIVCLALISVPPAVLLWYPLGWRLLSLCGLGENKQLNQASRFIPLAN